MTLYYHFITLVSGLVGYGEGGGVRPNPTTPTPGSAPSSDIITLNSLQCPAAHMPLRDYSHSYTYHTLEIIDPGTTPLWKVKPRLHDTTCCQAGCQQQVVSCIQTSNRLSNRLYNRFDNRLDVCLHDAAGCPTGCQTGWTTGRIV